MLIKKGAGDGLDLNDDFDAEYRYMKDSIDGLKNVLLTSQPLQVLQPAFQWAQSGTHIYLNIKFSHRMDAPSTLDVVVDNCTIGDDTFDLVAIKPPKKFNLHLDLFGEVVAEESHWSLSSVGKLSASLKKRSKKVWGGLLKGREILKQMHLWYDKQSQFATELSMMEEWDEEELMREDKEENSARTRKKGGGGGSASGAAADGSAGSGGKGKKMSFAKKKAQEAKQQKEEKEREKMSEETAIQNQIASLQKAANKRLELYEKEAKVCFNNFLLLCLI